ncbi:hypothetical protein LSH36_155g00003 [Paralvinella palmiformis]|uniref:Uncharacterized protein n=1 Tax=Paralvinella palmiformis TaxID=53620 RepID=A0AAD9N745_9ANNE|nr:hypothetical protein LSH36_155g00003 [Paralvinella palmiformis]
MLYDESQSPIVGDPRPFPIADHVILAPYWSTIDLYRGGSSNLYYRHLTNGEELINGTAQNKTNTFQTVLITDGKLTFVQFNYKHLNWPNDPSSSCEALMGFNIGDGKTFYSHQASLTGNITQLQDTSNVNITGRWMFRVDATDIGDEISCDKIAQIFPFLTIKSTTTTMDTVTSSVNSTKDGIIKTTEIDHTSADSSTDTTPMIPTDAEIIPIPTMTIDISESVYFNETMDLISITEDSTSELPGDNLTVSDLYNDSTVFSSIFSESYTTEQLTTATPSCDDDPCLNGNCTEVNDTIVCVCFPGYTGVLCEYDIDECLSEPCQNGGSCTDLIADYKCTCPRGYVGKSCENKSVIRVLFGKKYVIISCDFETDLCDISENLQYSGIPWTRHFGASPREETGPDVARYGDYYALVCLEFKYYLYGSTVGSISIYQAKVTESPHQGRLLWREADYSYRDWQSAYINTTITPEYDKTWHESCLQTGDGYPETLSSTMAQYAHLTTVNGFWWRVRHLSKSANGGDLQSIRYCYGRHSDCHYKGVARISAYFGQGSGSIMMKDVNCRNTNTNLYECEKRDHTDGRWQCGHKEDSGVICIQGDSLGQSEYPVVLTPFYGDQRQY